MRRALVACAGAAGGVLLSAAPAFAATTGAQSFTLTSNHHGTAHVVATGPIHGQGIDHPVSDSHDVFEFRKGNVGVNHAATAQRPGPQAGCTFFYTERGTYELTGGTGAYRGASGSGTYTLTDVFFAKTLPNGDCSQRAGHDVLLVSATGHTTLPS